MIIIFFKYVLDNMTPENTIPHPLWEFGLQHFQNSTFDTSFSPVPIYKTLIQYKYNRTVNMTNIIFPLC